MLLKHESNRLYHIWFADRGLQTRKVKYCTVYTPTQKISVHISAAVVLRYYGAAFRFDQHQIFISHLLYTSSFSFL